MLYWIVGADGHKSKLSAKCCRRAIYSYPSVKRSPRMGSGFDSKRAPDPAMVMVAMTVCSDTSCNTSRSMVMSGLLLVLLNFCFGRCTTRFCAMNSRTAAFARRLECKSTKTMRNEKTRDYLISLSALSPTPTSERKE